MKRPARFDADYYRRYYGNSRTAVTSRAEMARRADFVGSFVRYIDLPVRSILDAGCGVGWMRRPLLRHFPKARYAGLETSEYLCAKYGWTRGSVATYKPAAPFDLVICYDVLQYLDETAARKAMANLGRLARGALYFSALTEEDWDFYCDQERTDRYVNVRPGRWYRQRLKQRFVPAGGGLHLRKNIGVQLWELERFEGEGA